MVAEQQLSAMADRLVNLEGAVGRIIGDMKDHARGIEEQKATLVSQLNQEFESHKLAMAGVVDEARREFTDLKAGLTALYTATEQSMSDLKRRMDGHEARASAEHPKKGKGYIPLKSMVPDKFSDKEEEWRQWQDDMADYLDNQEPGMKKLLKEIEASANPVDEEWIKAKGTEYDDKVIGDGVNVWRALKTLTGGEARKVVMSVRPENGFQAWQKLHMRFGPSLAARQGAVLSELSMMVTKPAKNPTDTKILVTELERRIKLVDDITGDGVGDNHAKSVLVGILDPMTRQHTAMYHGSTHNFEQLKKAVLEFVNNATRRDDAMQVGCIASEENPVQSQIWNEDEEPYLGAVSSWKQCYNCNGFGHFARECPKGKGKGSDKGKGKGASDGPKGKGKSWDAVKGGKGTKGKGKKGPTYGTCWNCGGDHYMVECPAKGKGKGSKGLYVIEEEWYGEEAQGPTIKALGRLTAVPTCEKGCSHTSRALGAKGEVAAGEAEEGVHKVVGDAGETWSLASYCKSKRRQGDVKRERREKQRPTMEAGAVRMFRTIEPEGIHAMGQSREWEEVEMAVDSGASETVMGPEMLEGVETKESLASRRGVEYEVANGIRIPNLGEKQFKGITDEGLPRNLRVQVCDVNKPLLSVSKIVQGGNRVVFDGSGSYIEDKASGERMWLQEKGGMFMLKMWVKNDGF